MKLSRVALFGFLGLVWACSSNSPSGTGGSGSSGNGVGNSGSSNSGVSTGSGSSGGGTGSNGGSGAGPITGSGNSSPSGSSGSITGSGVGSGAGSSGDDAAVAGDDATSGASTGSSNSDASSGASTGSPSGSSGMAAATGTMYTSGMGATTPPADVMGCGSTKLYQTDATNPEAQGPWPVGVQTVMVPGMNGGTRPVEVWYPAQFGSESGKPSVTYDLTSWLPAGQASKIPMTDPTTGKLVNKPQPCNCYRDIPLDTSHGPYPAVIFIHGTGSFRTANLTTMTQWASHGFIAVAADHAGIYLGDFLGSLGGNGCKPPTGITYPSPGPNYKGDVSTMITALTNNSSGPFSFLGKNVDMSRIGVSGHSAGAAASANCGVLPNVQVDMPLADLGGVVPSGSALKSVLLMGGTNDSVVQFTADQSAYSGATAAIKRLVGITAGNHLDVTDLCEDVNDDGQTGIQVAQKYGVCGATLLAALAKCGNVQPVYAGPSIVNYVTTAVLEETLHCQNRDMAFSNLKTTWPQVATFTHVP